MIWNIIHFICSCFRFWWRFLTAPVSQLNTCCTFSPKKTFFTSTKSQEPNNLNLKKTVFSTNLNNFIWPLPKIKSWKKQLILSLLTYKMRKFAKTFRSLNLFCPFKPCWKTSKKDVKIPGFKKSLEILKMLFKSMLTTSSSKESKSKTNPSEAKNLLLEFKHN